MRPTPLHNAFEILDLYNRVKVAPERAPRGQKVRDLWNGSATLDLAASPCTSFEARKFNLNYAKKELLWYLQADKQADWIEQHATMWKKLKQEDGSYHSNYGQYIFGDCAAGTTQFDYVVQSLKNDRDTRRASMVLLHPNHLYHDNTDMVCTHGIDFTIMDNKLHMSVYMRSNDVIFGFTNDVFCFWWIAQLVYYNLLETYPDLELGKYYHHAHSMHVYDRHYDMIEQITSEGYHKYVDIMMPELTMEEAHNIVLTKGRSRGPVMTWLTE